MSDSITLVPKSEDDVTLPSSLATSKLTLAELGALFCLASLPNHLAADNGEQLAKRMSTPEFVVVSQKLVELGLIELTGQGKRVTINS